MEIQRILLARVVEGEPIWQEKLALLVVLVAEAVRRAGEEGTLPPWPVRGPTREGGVYSYWTCSEAVRIWFSILGSEELPEWK